MSWHETHLRSQALRDVEAAIDRDPSAALPWHDTYADLFGDAAGLAAYLRYRWRLRLTDRPLDDRHREHPALRRARVGLAVLDLQEHGLAHAS